MTQSRLYSHFVVDDTLCGGQPQFISVQWQTYRMCIETVHIFYVMKRTFCLAFTCIVAPIIPYAKVVPDEKSGHNGLGPFQHESVMALRFCYNKFTTFFLTIFHKDFDSGMILAKKKVFDS